MLVIREEIKEKSPTKKFGIENDPDFWTVRDRKILEIIEQQGKDIAVDFTDIQLRI